MHGNQAVLIDGLGIMRELSLHCEGQEYQTRSFTFPGGEIQVQVPGIPQSLSGDLTVMARLQSPEAVLQLVLLTEVLDRVHEGKRTLVIPYFPYARQDRVMAGHEAFSLKAIARIINSLNFARVIACDPHSDVTPALVDRLQFVTQVDLIKTHEGVGRIIHSGVTVVSPDAGASKKAFAVAQHYSLPLLTASKIRDVRTGVITSTEVQNPEAIAGRNALIIDDICDGGRTFIELARVLRAAGAAKVYLFVTHGIFSQGLDVFDGLIDEVFTTDSFLSRDVEASHQSPVPLHVASIRGFVCP